MKNFRRLIFGICFLLAASAVQAQGWQFGIGTGFYGMNFDGDGGFNTVLAGPINYEVDLDSSDTSDLLESAFGLGGYARNGRWTIMYGFGELELEDNFQALTVGGSGGNLDVTFTKTAAELALAYQFDISGNHLWGILGGFRYTGHEWKSDFTLGATPVPTGNVDESWTDFIVGLTHAYALSDTLIWSSRIDLGIGSGDSEGSTFIDTGLTWRFADSWSSRFYVSSTQHDYQNDNPGDPDYYFYDTEEFGAGISIVFHW